MSLRFPLIAESAQKSLQIRAIAVTPILVLTMASAALATGETTLPEPVVSALSDSGDGCKESLSRLGADAAKEYAFFCRQAESLKVCSSHEGRAISHMDLGGKPFEKPNKGEKRVLVFGLIHGDEPLAGRLALEWIKRLQDIEPRNTWRVVPLLNPDGLKRLTRMNAHKVDLNRNFPTRDWDEQAIADWQSSQRNDPRRYPGASAASEPETQCAIAHIKDFKPDFIVSVHTPYAVLDFDGPRTPFPKYKPLPWRALGNFPGSLGRYMWKDNGLPVLTIELKDHLVDAAVIQDVVGKLAIDASKRAEKKNENWADLL